MPSSVRAARRRFLRFLAQSPLLYGLGAAGAAFKLSAQEVSGLGQMVESAADALNVFDLEVAMKAKLNPGHWAYMAQGSDDSATIAANREAFKKIALKPRRLVDARRIDTSIELFGERYAAPIFLCPVGAQGAFHPEGEVAVARAAKTRNALQVLSTVTNRSVEDVIAARGAPIWYQLYPAGEWEVTKKIVKRAEAAGAKALVFTVDLPARNLEPIARFKRDTNPFCQACHEPGNVASFRKKPMFDGVEIDSMGGMSVAGLTWDYVDRLKDATSMKVLVKGIVTAEDAQRCLDHGADGIVVSNHGGRADESLRGSIDSLRDVLGAVGGRVPVLCDSGFRRGTDVFKALALGATAVGVGRPYIWGLGAFGEEGVERALALLSRELNIVMAQMGTTKLSEITPSSLYL